MKNQNYRYFLKILGGGCLIVFLLLQLKKGSFEYDYILLGISLIIMLLPHEKNKKL